MPNQQGQLVGTIAHFFNKIGVAVIELTDVLKVGDSIKIVGKNTDFEQVVDSMEMDKQKIETAAAGNLVGLKINQKAKEGSRVFKL
jgi:putative protease